MVFCLIRIHKYQQLGLSMDPSQAAGHNDGLPPIVVIVESGPCRLLILVYAMVRVTAGRPCGW